MAEIANILFRTEDIHLEEILEMYVETEGDREIVNDLKSRVPVLLRGSRGVGKSFLIRVAQAELLNSWDDERVLPVYVTFSRAGLLSHQNDGSFIPWMMAKIIKEMKRALAKQGLQLSADSILLEMTRPAGDEPPLEEQVISSREDSFWSSHLPAKRERRLTNPEDLVEAAQEICEDFDIRRIILLIDEAAHVFVPEQQRQFFTMMRDLRSPYLSVKASVYPGATSFGSSFQPTHDAAVRDVERDVTAPSYEHSMREILRKQNGGAVAKAEESGRLLDVLAYASMGNPRVLLKTFAECQPFNSRNVKDVIKRYYTEQIWSEHSSLAERYPGHAPLINWGRKFVEQEVLPGLRDRNKSAEAASSAIWVHRDAPQAVREALSLLSYSGIVQEGVHNIKATRSELGSRFLVNLGCNLAGAEDVIEYGKWLHDNLSIKRMKEFGADHSNFSEVKSVSVLESEDALNQALQSRLMDSYTELDLTNFQKEKLSELGVATIRDVLECEESSFMGLHYIGKVRARQIHNAAQMAVIEYLSG